MLLIFGCLIAFVMILIAIICIFTKCCAMKLLKKHLDPMMYASKLPPQSKNDY